MSQTQRTRPEAQHCSHSVQRHAEKEEKHNSNKSVTAPLDPRSLPRRRVLAAAPKKRERKPWPAPSLNLNRNQRAQAVSEVSDIAHAARRCWRPPRAAGRHRWQNAKPAVQRAFRRATERCSISRPSVGRRSFVSNDAGRKSIRNKRTLAHCKVMGLGRDHRKIRIIRKFVLAVIVSSRFHCIPDC